jgi:hypothetical protein
MKRFLIFGLVGLAALFLVAMVSADSSSHKYFIGLWEGVDPNDGSRRTVSISDNDQDGVFDLVQYDTYWTLCGDDRGVTDGTATLGANGLLQFSGTLTCLSTGTTVPFSVDYQAFRKADILVEIPVGVPLSPDTLHRVSSR